MNALSSSYGIIMNIVIKAPGHGNKFVDRINATEKHYLKEQIEFIGQISSNDTSNIRMIPTASIYVSDKFKYQYIHNIKNKDRLNGLKGSTKMQNR